MGKILLVGILMSVSVFSVGQKLKNPEVIHGELIKKVSSLTNLRKDPTFNPRVTRDLTGIVMKKSWKDDIRDYGTRAAGDPVVQKQHTSSPDQIAQPSAGTAITSNFDGMGFSNVAPADPTMAAGPSHVIQMINGSQGAYLRIWDKNGSTVVSQVYLYQLFASPGYAGVGDPIVLYDQFADRYVMTEFGTSAGVTSYINTLIMAVSQTNNPTGGWYIYKFVDNTFFVDYPHYAAWPDAYYATSNDFNTAGNAYLGSSIYAFEKNKMLAGDATASMQRFRLTSTDYSKFVSTAPVNISGSTPPPAGSPGLFMYYHDDNRTSITTDVDSVGIITLQPDFSNPANSVLTFTQQMTVAPFKANVCPNRSCVGSASGLYDAISDRFMNKLYYRNFGTHEAIVGTHTVDAAYPATPSQSALRWYEFRRSGGLWNVYQQGTYAPDGNSRWMGSININSQGQIALAYNHSSASTFASINVTGRNSGDPSNLMVYDEMQLVKGDAYGSFGSRWGDYNDMVLDPVNDSIFWFTAMYGSTTWKTRISAFKLEPLPLLDVRLVSINNPTQGMAQCSPSVTPSVSIRNVGSSDLTALTIHWQLDNGSPSAFAWTGNLSLAQTQLVALPSFVTSPGQHTLRIYTSNPNGSNDENKNNDTSFVTFSILAPINGQVLQGFESSSFPPSPWRILNPDAGSMTWERNASVGKSGVASAVLKHYDYSNPGHTDYLLGPLLNVAGADSVILSFERAYRIYGTASTFADTLEVVVSTDCGATFTTVWSRGGAALATVSGTQTTSYVPAAADWQNTRLDIKPFIGAASSVTVGFKSINRFGQNLYLDDINLKAFKLPDRDVFVRSVVEPSSRVCARATLPVIDIASLGRDTLTSVKLVYTIQSLPSNAIVVNDSVQWTGSLSSGRSMNVSLKSVTLPAAGRYTLTVISHAPNQLDDENNFNDTLRTTFTVLDPQSDPITQSFEQTTFPPSAWTMDKSNASYSWERTLRASSERSAAAWIRNYRFNSNNKTDDLYSPLTKIGSVDSVYVRFDVAHVTSKFPGSTRLPLDTLEVLVTMDCGKSLISVYKKWGEDLQSIRDPNFPVVYPAADTVGFVPVAAWQWRKEFIDVTRFVPANSQFQVVFRNTSNRGNNTFLDDVAISTVTLPARLKRDGYLIVPNPFANRFAVQHLLPPVTLRGIQVIGSSGQIVFERAFSGNASNYISVDLSRFARGVYTIKMIYDTKVITERIVKN